MKFILYFIQIYSFRYNGQLDSIESYNTFEANMQLAESMMAKFINAYLRRSASVNW